MQPLSAPGTGAFALMLGMLAHSVGWPVVEGGSQRITDALLREIEATGGAVHTGRWVSSLEELPRTPVTLLDLTPKQLLEIAAERIPRRSARALGRFRYGPGVCKVDWALSGPVPWEAEACRRTATIHLGGTLEEIAQGEREVSQGRHPERPFCIVVQPSVLDPGRAPAGHQTFYAYCHVPLGSTVEMTERIEARIERFAPGFRDLVLARQTVTAAAAERANPKPYATPLPGVYMCSSSTPPGGGVHGMCGEGAAQAALSARAAS
jgi:phytoene dehydrogenase-like protein